MTTPMQAFAAVASRLGRIPLDNEPEIQAFYDTVFPRMPLAAREVVFDFLIAACEVPSDADLKDLEQAIHDATASALDEVPETAAGEPVYQDHAVR